jgi:hypothetical protein
MFIHLFVFIHGFLIDAVHLLEFIAASSMMMNKEFKMIWKWGSLPLSRDYPCNGLGGVRRTNETSVRVVNVLAKIYTEEVSNISQNYCLCHLALWILCHTWNSCSFIHKMYMKKLDFAFRWLHSCFICGRILVQKYYEVLWGISHSSLIIVFDLSIYFLILS